MPPVVSAAEVEQIIASGLSPAALEGVIAREEAWLTRRVGPLVGERTQVLWPTDPSGPLHLRRPTTGVVVMQQGGPVATRLIGDGRVELVSGAWSPPVSVTYTPDDGLEVKRVLIELVRMAVTASPFVQEGSSGDGPGHTAQRAGSQAAMREDLARSLAPSVANLTMSIPFGNAPRTVSR